jgi:hypothetical protein
MHIASLGDAREMLDDQAKVAYRLGAPAAAGAIGK